MEFELKPFLLNILEIILFFSFKICLTFFSNKALSSKSIILIPCLDTLSSYVGPIPRPVVPIA